ncbi:MAG: hypothetical protein DMF61_23640 [Blastocatellia bacterium AA13]|nr:MAG: hypothetical protein DMF61_23640 [Blastocatellia bacterium AA13]
MKLFAFIKKSKDVSPKLYRVDTRQKMTRGQLLSRMNQLSEKRRRMESIEIGSGKIGKRGPRARTKRSDDPPSRWLTAGAAASDRPSSKNATFTSTP